jgi:hypothetical protein
MRYAVALTIFWIGCGPQAGPRPGEHEDSGTGSPGSDGGGHDLAMSGGGDDGGQGGGNFSDLCNGASTTIVGTVRAPNGIDPVSNARVYVPSQVNPMPKGVACDACGSPVDGAETETTSAPDGTFSLTLDYIPKSASVKLAVVKGRFRHIGDFAVQCGPNTAPASATSLPGKSADGDIPKIAVGTGNKDHLDQVLVALGITEFTCLEGRKSPSSAASCTTTGKLSDLLTGQNGLAIDDYDMVFIGCAPGAYAAYAGLNISTATITQTLQGWTAKGGRLFVTDNSYDYVAEAFPQELAWQGPAAMPWTIDGANVGVAGNGMLTATVDDPVLAAWLKVVGVQTSPMVTVGGILGNWSVQKGPVAMGTSQIADGNATFTVNNTMMTADVPLTTGFPVNQCGKVVYSSYHTLSTVMQNQLSAQEKILEYLMLEIASCSSHM